MWGDEKIGKFEKINKLVIFESFLIMKIFHDTNKVPKRGYVFYEKENDSMRRR